MAASARPIDLESLSDSEQLSLSQISSMDSEFESKDSTETIGVIGQYGVPSHSTSGFSWNDIESTSEWTEQEIFGAKQLQQKLCVRFGVATGQTAEIHSHFPPFECLRYFCGCSMETDRAITKWCNSISMFREHKMGRISQSELRKCLDILSKSIAFGGIDNNGSRIVVIKYSFFFFSEMSGLSVFLLAGFLLFFYLTLQPEAHRNGICLVCDLEGFSLSNFSWTVEKNGIMFFQKVLPIRIKKIVVVDAPWLAHRALNLVLPLMVKKLRDRVAVIKREELYKSIGRQQIPMLIGGLFDQEYVADGRSFFREVMMQYLDTMSFDHFQKNRPLDCM